MAFDKSLVSIVLPVRNASEHLEECLKSLIGQTHENIEVIAIDDKSTDSSFKILKMFQKMDKRIKLQRNKKNYGLATCYNRALKKAKGQYVAFMDAHDSSSIKRVKTQLLFLKKNPKIAVVGAQCKFMNEKNKTLGKTSLPVEHETIYQQLQGPSLQFESVMVNRLLLPKDVLYFKKHTYPFIYIDVFMQVLKYGKAANLAQTLYYKRKLHKATTFTKLNMKHIKSYMKVLGNSITHEAYHPSFKSLFTPLVKGM